MSSIAMRIFSYSDAGNSFNLVAGENLAGTRPAKATPQYELNN
jgi:hypothetical protein